MAAEVITARTLLLRDLKLDIPGAFAAKHRVA